MPHTKTALQIFLTLPPETAETDRRAGQGDIIENAFYRPRDLLFL
jgi:hypothetical protein